MRNLRKLWDLIGCYRMCWGVCESNHRLGQPGCVVCQKFELGPLSRPTIPEYAWMYQPMYLIRPEILRRFWICCQNHELLAHVGNSGQRFQLGKKILDCTVSVRRRKCWFTHTLLHGGKHWTAVMCSIPNLWRCVQLSNRNPFFCSSVSIFVIHLHSMWVGELRNTIPRNTE